MKKKKDWRVTTFGKYLFLFTAACLFLIVLINVYLAWIAVNTKISAEFDCQVNQIDYVNLTGSGKCFFPFVQGEESNVSMCALPRDVHCRGAMADFPLARVAVMGGLT